ncbi:hypothetical protein GCM10009853_054380 [Glycomyces scopariae]
MSALRSTGSRVREGSCGAGPFAPGETNGRAELGVRDMERVCPGVVSGARERCFRDAKWPAITGVRRLRARTPAPGQTLA